MSSCLQFAQLSIKASNRLKTTNSKIYDEKKLPILLHIDPFPNRKYIFQNQFVFI